MIGALCSFPENPNTALETKDPSLPWYSNTTMYIHGTLLVLVVTSLSKGQSLLYLAYRCAYILGILFTTVL